MLSLFEPLCVFLIGFIAAVFLAGGTDLWQMLRWHNFARALALVTVASLATLDIQLRENAFLRAEFQNPAAALAAKDAEIASLNRQLAVERDAVDHLEDQMSVMKFNRMVWRGLTPFQLIHGPRTWVYEDAILENEDTCTFVRPCLVTDYDSDLCPFDFTMLVWQ